MIGNEERGKDFMKADDQELNDTENMEDMSPSKPDIESLSMEDVDSKSPDSNPLSSHV